MSDAPSGYQIVSTGLEHIINETQYQVAVEKVIEIAFEELFRQQKAGNLVWRRTGRRMNILTTTVSIRLGVVGVAGAVQRVPFYLTYSYSDSSDLNIFLSLGSLEDSPCRNNADERVEDLFKELCL